MWRVGQDWCWLLAETWAGTGAAPTLLPLLLYNFYLYHWCSKALPSSYFTIIPHPLASPCSSVKTAILYDIHPATFSLPDPLPFYLHVTSTGTFSFKPWRVQQDMCLWETLELFTEHIIEHLYIVPNFRGPSLLKKFFIWCAIFLLAPWISILPRKVEWFIIPKVDRPFQLASPEFNLFMEPRTRNWNKFLLRQIRILIWSPLDRLIWTWIDISSYLYYSSTSWNPKYRNNIWQVLNEDQNLWNLLSGVGKS